MDNRCPPNLGNQVSVWQMTWVEQTECQMSSKDGREAQNLKSETKETYVILLQER